MYGKAFRTVADDTISHGNTLRLSLFNNSLVVLVADKTAFGVVVDDEEKKVTGCCLG